MIGYETVLGRRGINGMDWHWRNQSTTSRNTLFITYFILHAHRTLLYYLLNAQSNKRVTQLIKSSANVRAHDHSITLTQTANGLPIAVEENWYRERWTRSRGARRRKIGRWIGADRGKCANESHAACVAYFLPDRIVRCSRLNPPV